MNFIDLLKKKVDDKLRNKIETIIDEKLNDIIERLKTLEDNNIQVSRDVVFLANSIKQIYILVQSSQVHDFDIMTTNNKDDDLIN